MPGRCAAIRPPGCGLPCRHAGGAGMLCVGAACRQVLCTQPRAARHGRHLDGAGGWRGLSRGSARRVWGHGRGLRRRSGGRGAALALRAAPWRTAPAPTGNGRPSRCGGTPWAPSPRAGREREREREEREERGGVAEWGRVGARGEKSRLFRALPLLAVYSSQ
jgi:hypothetical protein